ncbi:MAG: hypothetical protein GOMPHAMPRED_000256 [Gomphillus americanus]|uniref:WD40 repeat domain-containing protein n=1 Tax=Gomphillus americanus TaxID=1940652 RepID=A0A8H3I4W6_9LECA|nr:MAG: hypothetical protein GOMPHAMPRED_000256 [Gomphillus americanus]
MRQTKIQTPLTNNPKNLGFLLSGDTFAEILNDGNVSICEASSGIQRHTIRNCAGNSLLWLDNAKLIMGKDDGALQICDLITGQTENGQRHRVVSADLPLVAVNGTSLALASRHRDEIVIWDIVTGKLERVLQNGFYLYLSKITFAGNDTLVAHSDHAIQIWDIVSGSSHFLYRSHRSLWEDVRFSPDGHFLQMVQERSIHIWDAQNATASWSLVGGGAYSMNSTRYLSESTDLVLFSKGIVKRGGTFSIWNIGTRALCLVTDGEYHSRQFRSRRFSPDGMQMATILEECQTATSSKGNKILIWNLITGELVHTLSGISTVFISLHYSPDGHYLVSISHSHTVHLWNVNSGTLQHAFAFKDHLDVSFSTNSQHMVIWSIEGECMVYDILGAKTKHLFCAYPLYDAVISEDGCQLVTPSKIYEGNTLAVAIWSVITGEQQYTYDLGRYISFKSLCKNDQYLDTSRGRVKLQQDSNVFDCLRQLRSNGDIFISDQWVMIGRKRLLFLPPAYRPIRIDYHDGKLIMAFLSGCMLLYDSRIEGLGHTRVLIPKEAQAEKTINIEKAISKWCLDHNSDGARFLRHELKDLPT